MNNVAICIFGLPRGNVVAWKSIVKHVINPCPNSKVFISTWNTSKEKQASWHKYREPGSKQLKKFISFWIGQERVDQLKISKQMMHLPEKITINNQTVFYRNQVSMWTSVLEAITLAEQNFKPDEFICIRADLMFKQKLQMTSPRKTLICSGAASGGKIDVEDLAFAFHRNEIGKIENILAKTKSSKYAKQEIRNPLIEEFGEDCEIQIGTPKIGSDFSIARPPKTMAQILEAVKKRVQ